MAAVIIIRDGDAPGTADRWYLTGTGWQTTQAAGTQYASKEAAMADAETLVDAGPGGTYRIIVKDLAAGQEYPVREMKA